MKRIFLLLFLIFLYCISFSQTECGVTQDMSNNKEASIPYCGILSSYRPDNVNIITKYIRVNIHVMQKSDGTGNFQANDPQHITYLNSIIPYINNMCLNIEEPYYGGPTGDYYIQDAKIQFILKGIYFHQDDYGFISSKHICDSYWFNTYKINDDTELNIFLTNSTLIYGGAGCGQGYSGELYNFINSNLWYEDYLQNPPGTYGQNHLGGTPWVKNPHLLHEIGHCLNIHHSWFPSQYALFPDIYSPQATGWCNPSTDFQCVNNIMSYSATKTFLSPMQLEFLHKELTFSWRKKLVANCEETIIYPIVVNQNENWDYAISIANLLTISNNAIVDVSCNLDYVENSIVTIDQFSVLNFNNAEITTCKNCSELTFNVSGNMNYINTPFILSPNSVLNISSTGVVNIYNADGLCINQGAQINIASGGKLYINGQDYTSVITNGYNNIYDKFFSNQTITTGTHYAFNEISTSGTVNTIPGTPTELIAGRKIVLTPQFTGYNGLHAKIDFNINNCEETPCGTGLRLARNNNATISYSPTYNETKNLLFQINIAPNPNNGKFNLSVTSNTITNNKTIDKIYVITIFNTLGTKVFDKQVDNLDNDINISELPKGIYYVSVTINDKDKVGEAIIIR